MKPVSEPPKAVRISFPRGTLGNGSRTETEVFLLDQNGNQTRKIQGQAKPVCAPKNQWKDVFNVEIGQKIRTITITIKKRNGCRGEAVLAIKGNGKEGIVIEESFPRSFHPPFSIEGDEN